MPAMYPEELRRLREQNPGLQFDFRGNLIDDGGYGTGLEQQFYDKLYGPIGDQIRNAFYGKGNLLGGLMSGSDGYNYQNDQFVGPVLPGQTQGYTYSDYDQAGPLQPGVSRSTLGGEQFGPSLPGMPRPGQHLDLGTPRAGLHTRWNPNTNSWDRMTDNPDSWSEAGAMDFSKWGQETPH